MIRIMDPIHIKKSRQRNQKQHNHQDEQKPIELRNFGIHSIPLHGNHCIASELNPAIKNITHPLFQVNTNFPRMTKLAFKMLKAQKFLEISVADVYGLSLLFFNPQKTGVFLLD